MVDFGPFLFLLLFPCWVFFPLFIYFLFLLKEVPADTKKNYVNVSHAVRDFTGTLKRKKPALKERGQKKSQRGGERERDRQNPSIRFKSNRPSVHIHP